MSRTLIALLALVSIVLSTNSADAKRYKHRHHRVVAQHVAVVPAFDSATMGTGSAYSGGPRSTVAARAVRSSPTTFTNYRVRPERIARAAVDGAVSILPHPQGCPYRAFCGCGAMKYLGLNDRSLWLARTWFRYPRAAPAPNMAEVRPHHVRIITADLGGGYYRFYDANSGGRLTRSHVDTIKGTVVNPMGTRYASAVH